MKVYAFEPIGFEGELVTVEVDLRRGIPSVDLVGLPDGAIKEARERIRAAIRNAGFQFPLERLLINLAPAGVRKAGASFDLPMALAVLFASGQIPDSPGPVLALGELELSGRVRSVSGALPAVAAGLKAGVARFIVPRPNLREARVLAGAGAWALDSLVDASDLAGALRGGFPAASFQDPGIPAPEAGHVLPATESPEEDISDIKGQARLKRAMEIAAAGGHHLLLFGPPGAGKTMAARRLVGLLPDLDDDEAITATMLHSLAGELPDSSGLLRRPPFRAPHHGASAEGMVGGGRVRKPGEVSLAHGGVLFLDEALEFRSDVLQALREPLEDGRISIARAERAVTYPSRFILVLAVNPCPCGNLGKAGAVCLCSPEEIHRYWKRLGGALLDRVDIRVPVSPSTPAELALPAVGCKHDVRARVKAARSRQARRYGALSFRLNGRLPPREIDAFCRLDGATEGAFVDKATRAGFSSRACHSVLRIARTIADIEDSETIAERHIDEALGLRLYGEENVFWQIP